MTKKTLLNLLTVVGGETNIFLPLIVGTANKIDVSLSTSPYPQVTYLY